MSSLFSSEFTVILNVVLANAAAIYGEEICPDEEKSVEV